MLDTNRPDLVLGIVGTGLMGRGIAQIAVQGRVKVLLHDTRLEAAQEARTGIVQTLNKLAEKGKMTQPEAEAASLRLAVAENIEQLSPCHIVIEAIVENLEAKRSLFQKLESIVTDDCVLATNTSSLPVTAIAAACRLPGRVGGFHFFSPVPLMKIVEVIGGVLSDAWVGDALTTLAKRMGHTPVRAQDTPGFIVNHAGRAYGTEALRILGEGIAEYPEIDNILREEAGFRMGPFELLDLTGLDVSHPVMESIYDQYYQEPRFRPSPITRLRLAAGLLGRKSKRGFYEYVDGQKQPLPSQPQTASSPATTPDVRVWVSRKNAQGYATVSELLGKLNIPLDNGERPAADSLCLVLPIGQDATTSATEESLDATRTLALDPLFLTKRRTLMATPVTSLAMRAAACTALSADGVPVSLIHDSPGFIVQRVVACIVNVGCDIAQQRIATPADIDRAVTLGLGYPRGPLAMGDALGAQTILDILNAMHCFYGDPRYRPSPWLTRRARLGVSLLTPETPEN